MTTSGLLGLIIGALIAGGLWLMIDGLTHPHPTTIADDGGVPRPAALAGGHGGAGPPQPSPE